jgi:hypothetical protein
MTTCPFRAEDIQNASIVCMRTMGVIAVIVLALIGAGCGSGDHGTPPVAGAALRALDSAQGSVKDASRRYFQRMLITEGADLQSSFGADLASLDLDGRKLQTLPVDDSYKAAHDATLLVEDCA